MILKPRPFRKLKKGHWATKGFIGFWPFYEGDGNTVLDLSGNGFDGTFGAGAASPIWVPGKYGSALSFDGDDYVTTTLTPYKIHNATTGDITFNIWVNFNSTAANQSPIGADEGGVDRFYLNTVVGGHIKVGVGSWLTQYNNVVTAGKWTLYSVVISGTTGYFYVDGKLSGTEPGLTINYPDTVIHFGRIATFYYLNGLIDFPSIYNYALSSSKIALLCREPFCMFERDPIELWSATTLGVAPPVGMAGAMTTNTGYWGW